MATSTAYPQGSNMQGIGTGGIMGINSPLPGLINKHISFINPPNVNQGPIANPYQNSLAVQPSEGDALVKEIEMRMAQKDIKSPAFNAYAADVMKTKGFPTKTLEEYQPETNISPMPMQPINSGGDFGVITQPGGPQNPNMGGIMPLPGPGLKSLPEIPDYTEKFSGYDTKIGGFDNQFKDIIGRLDKLEQGIGSMANTDVPAPTPVQGGVPSVYTGNNARGY